ncbi:unnamed protein product [Prorocentrum cordatum]|uniref:Pentapeptide repeat-containing protein n=1 Tax=Prorocentrum cordatum TaxID=2364126 RepID=A0ABN9XU95_9DINO|nr:unnamed protein product [Polarella glacialis]
MQDSLHVEDLPDRQDSWSERWARSKDGPALDGMASIGLQQANLGAIGLAQADAAALDITQIDGAAIGLKQANLKGLGISQLGDTAAGPSGASLGFSLPENPFEGSGGLQLGFLAKRLNELAKGCETPLATRAQESPGDEQPEKVIEEAWRTRTAKSRTAIASKYDRFKKGSAEEQEKYKNAQGHIGKENCILEWVDKQWNAYQERKSKRKTNTEAHLEWGTHEPFEVIAGKESGVGITETGAMAALNTVLACQKLGCPWAQWNSFTKRAEYLYCKSGFKNKFETAWAQCQEQTGVQDDLALDFLKAQTGAAAQQQSEAKQQAADEKKAAAVAKQKEAEAKKAKEAEEKQAKEAEAKAKAAAKAAARGTKRTRGDRGGTATPPPEPAGDDAPHPKQAKKDAKKKLDDFRTLISLYGQELTSGKMILRNIGPVASWEPLADERMSGDLRRAVEALENTSTTNALVAQLADFDKQIDQISSILRPKVDRLNAEVDALNQMHALVVKKAQGGQ